jgi:hypothetical protein
VTRRLTEKCAQFCLIIAQNGALVNMNFYPKKYPVKILRQKVAQNLKLIKVNFGRFFEKKLRPNHLSDIFQKKNAPNDKKYRPNGEISPNLVTPAFVFSPQKQNKFRSFNRLIRYVLFESTRANIAKTYK